ncbi:hypothetical protein TNCV_4943961 [Trichonephila clavipes]|nr:hypothetical protein TNCV_4943961 [Trichonephila clavipes]
MVADLPPSADLLLYKGYPSVPVTILDINALAQGWADFSRLAEDSVCVLSAKLEFPNIITNCQNFQVVTPKCLGGPPVDRDRRNAHPDFRISLGAFSIYHTW